MLVLVGLWSAVATRPAVGAPAGEDAAAMVGCPTCKVLVDQEVHLLSDYCDRGMA